ncbi:hypothetical protein N0V90_004212 [Kalmusia sp. IMI 367209]|nr:hypothetical protein N0V90_004212 [Kalmusia sp. IMI 367209]
MAALIQAFFELEPSTQFAYFGFLGSTSLLLAVDKHKRDRAEAASLARLNVDDELTVLKCKPDGIPADAPDASPKAIELVQQVLSSPPPPEVTVIEVHQVTVWAFGHRQEDSQQWAPISQVHAPEAVPSTASPPITFSSSAAYTGAWHVQILVFTVAVLALWRRVSQLSRDFGQKRMKDQIQIKALESHLNSLTKELMAFKLKANKQLKASRMDPSLANIFPQADLEARIQEMTDFVRAVLDKVKLAVQDMFRDNGSTDAITLRHSVTDAVECCKTSIEMTIMTIMMVAHVETADGAWLAPIRDMLREMLAVQIDHATAPYISSASPQQSAVFLVDSVKKHLSTIMMLALEEVLEERIANAAPRMTSAAAKETNGLMEFRSFVSEALTQHMVDLNLVFPRRMHGLKKVSERVDALSGRVEDLVSRMEEEEVQMQYD